MISKFFSHVRQDATQFCCRDESGAILIKRLKTRDYEYESTNNITTQMTVARGAQESSFENPLRHVCLAVWRKFIMLQAKHIKVRG